MPGFDYDLVAIGGGTGGLTVTRLVARKKRRVALIERARPGGDCLYTGCVPTKSLLHAAKLLYHARHGQRFGVVAEDVRLDFEAVRRHVAAAQHEAGKVESPEVIARNGVELITGEAAFLDEHTLEVNGRRLTAERIVIATGGEPAVPPIPGLAEAGFETNIDAVAWESLPSSLVIIGGGPIGTEFGQMMTRFGVRVTMLQGPGRILERDDPEASALIQKLLEREGMVVHTGVQVERVEREGSLCRVVFRAGGEQLVAEGERILVAAGRKPELASLQLERAGVATNARGVVVDETLRSSQKHIFAVGDVAGGYQFTHVAEAQGRVVANIILGKRFQKWSDAIVPRVTYTDPEVASVGLTEDDARKRFGRSVQVFRLPLEEVDRAITMGQTDGYVKVVTAKGWNRFVPGARGVMGDPIVGASIVAPGGGDLLMPIVVAMRAKLPIGLVAWNMQAYPTMALAVRQVTGMQFDR